jgi:Flp pilus assembly protein TadD
MRSADVRTAAAWLAVLALAGCAQLRSEFGESQPAPSAPAPAPAPVSETAARRPALPDDTSVTPAVLQAYEAALQKMHEGQLAEAEHDLAALSQAHPELGGPHANLGIVYRRSNRPDLAVQELEKAVHCNASQPVFWNQLGIAYREQGQIPKAREAYEKAISLDPGYPAPNLNLGILFDLYLWDSARALELYDRYLALTPGGDPKVAKWVADLNHRSREKAPAQRKEQE